MREHIKTGLVLAVLLLIPAFFLVDAQWNLAPDTPEAQDLPLVSDLEALVRERLPFSRELEQLGLDLRLLGGQREQNGIFISEEGLMRNIDAPIETLVARNSEAVAQLAREVEAASGGKKNIYLAIFPTAAGVLRQNLPRFAQGEMFDQQRAIEEMYNRLPQSVRTIDVYSALYNRRGQYIYYRTDNGLTALGGYYSYAAIARRLEISNRSLSQFNIEYVKHDFYGDLYRAPSGSTGAWSSSSAPYRKVSPDIISLYTYSGNREYLVTQKDSGGEKVYHTLYPRHRMALGSETDIYFGGQAAVTEIRSSAPYRGKLLVFGDKTAAAYLPFLANHYGEVVLVDLYYARSSDLKQLALEEYDQILLAYGIESYIHTRNPSRVREVVEQGAA